MICGLSTISLMLGTAIACLANGYPKYQTAMETVAGLLLIGGIRDVGLRARSLFRTSIAVPWEMVLLMEGVEYR